MLIRKFEKIFGNIEEILKKYNRLKNIKVLEDLNNSIKKEYFTDSPVNMYLEVYNSDHYKNIVFKYEPSNNEKEFLEIINLLKDFNKITGMYSIDSFEIELLISEKLFQNRNKALTINTLDKLINTLIKNSKINKDGYIHHVSIGLYNYDKGTELINKLDFTEEKIRNNIMMLHEKYINNKFINDLNKIFGMHVYKLIKDSLNESKYEKEITIIDSSVPHISKRLLYYKNKIDPENFNTLNLAITKFKPEIYEDIKELVKDKIIREIKNIDAFKKHKELFKVFKDIKNFIDDMNSFNIDNDLYRELLKYGTKNIEIKYNKTSEMEINGIINIPDKEIEVLSYYLNSYVSNTYRKIGFKIQKEVQNRYADALYDLILRTDLIKKYFDIPEKFKPAVYIDSENISTKTSKNNILDLFKKYDKEFDEFDFYIGLCNRKFDMYRIITGKENDEYFFDIGDINGLYILFDEISGKNLQNLIKYIFNKNKFKLEEKIINISKNENKFDYKIDYEEFKKLFEIEDEFEIHYNIKKYLDFINLLYKTLPRDIRNSFSKQNKLYKILIKSIC